MTVKIGSNITSLNVQRNLGDATLQLSNSMERLSSGLRINRASDDAAGLAISENLKSSSRVYTTAIRNVNDGLSLLNIVDGALSELSNITTRQLELAQQSANGTYSKVQRQALDTEANALVKEYNRIIKTSTFNGQKVIDVDQSTGMVRIQAGFGVDGSLGLSMGQDLARYVGTGAFGTTVQYSTESNYSNAMQLADIDNDGDLDMITAGLNGSIGVATIRKNNGDGTFGQWVQYTTESSYSNAVRLADIDNDGDLDLVTSGTSGGVGTATIRKNNGDGTFGQQTQYTVDGTTSFDIQLADLNSDGYLDMVTGGTDMGNGKATIRMNNGDGSFGKAVVFSTERFVSNAVELGDIDSDGDLDLITVGYGTGPTATVRKNNGDGTFSRAVQYSTEGYSNDVKLADIDSDGDLDLISAGNNGTIGKVTFRKNNGDGTFGQSYEYTTEGSTSNAIQFADLDGDGDLDLITAGTNSGAGKATIRLNNGDGTFGSSVQYSSETAQSNGLQVADINGDGILDLVTAGQAANGKATIRFGEGHDVTTVAAISLNTQSSARSALTTLKEQLDRISAERGSVGSAQSRLSVTLNTLGTTRENFDAAASRITDVDVAGEAAQMTRNEILQRTGAAILAQANQAPEIALVLLR